LTADDYQVTIQLDDYWITRQSNDWQADRAFHAIFKAWPANPASIIPVLFITSSCAAMAARIFFSVKMTAQNSIYFFRKA
jgi:hypothetical protein